MDKTSGNCWSAPDKVTITGWTETKFGATAYCYSRFSVRGDTYIAGGARWWSAATFPLLSSPSLFSLPFHLVLLSRRGAAPLETGYGFNGNRTTRRQTNSRFFSSSVNIQRFPAMGVHPILLEWHGSVMSDYWWRQIDGAGPSWGSSQMVLIWLNWEGSSSLKQFLGKKKLIGINTWLG